MNLETKYYKDLNHNFLVIKSRKDEEKDSYRSKMVTGNHMKYFLPCRTRHINGENYFDYEVSSRQNMKQLFESRPLGLPRLRRLFEGIYEASEEAREYLLEDVGILLDPAFIFLNPGSEEYSFIYYPQEHDWEAAMSSFADYLVERVDREEECAVDIVYKVFERITSHTFILSEILDLFPAENVLSESSENAEMFFPEMERRTAGETESAGDMEYVGCAQYAGYAEEDREPHNGPPPGAGTYGRDLCETEEEQEIREDTGKTESGILGTLLLLIVSLAAAAGIFAMRYLFVLTAGETVLSIAGTVMLTVISAALLFHLIIALAGKDRKNHISRKEQRKRETEQAQGAECRWEIPPSPWAEPEDRTDREPTGNRGGQRGGQSGTQRDKQSICGNKNVYSENTVFFETSFSDKENKLYGISKGNRYHIDLSVLPCTVGKLAGCVDVVIKNDTVSRIHARFTEKEGEIFVTDLNSTNGTFKNGLRLEPNETALIEPGDELRFGKMAFCYR